MKYEYHVLETDKPTASQDQLNSLGEDGWQLVTIVCWDNRWFYYFTRIKPDA